MDNVELTVRREPSVAEREASGLEGRGELFGLYVGTPRSERADYNLTLPDQIVIFQGPLERHFHPRDIPRQVCTTVIHEVAHHFGIDDERLRALGLH